MCASSPRRSLAQFEAALGARLNHADSAGETRHVWTRPELGAVPYSSPLRTRLPAGDKGWQDILLLDPSPPLARAITNKRKVHALQHILHPLICHAHAVPGASPAV